MGLTWPYDDHGMLHVAFSLSLRNPTVYVSDELSPFVHSIVEKFEMLEQTSIAKTLEAFLKK